MSLSPFSIRLRLILWYVVGLQTTLMAFGAVVWVVVSFNLNRQVDLTLSQTAEQVFRATTVSSIQDITFLSLPQLDTFQASGLYVQVFDSDLKLVGETRNLGSMETPLDARSLDSAVTSGAVYADTHFGGLHLRVLTVPIEASDDNLGYLQVASSLRVVDEARNQLLVVILLGGFVSALLASVAGMVTASRVIKPLAHVTATAQSITQAQDLSKRVSYDGPEGDELGRMVTAFNRALNQLEHLFKAQRRFLADVSHELRTPLTSIRGNVDLMRMMGDRPDPESLDAIQSEAARMSRLVDDLLLLAQAETGNLPLAKQRVQLDELLLEVYRDALVLAGRRIAVLIADIDQVCAEGDRDRLKQVLLNLVANAVKFTPDNGRVTLGLTKREGYARFAVSDTGPGIPLEDQPHIFDRFYRTDKSRNRARGESAGAGLGLAIVRWIVDAHSGRIQVSSKPGEGTTFFVWLPTSPALPSNGKLIDEKIVHESTENLIVDLDHDG